MKGPQSIDKVQLPISDRRKRSQVTPQLIAAFDEILEAWEDLIKPLLFDIEWERE